MSQCSFTKPNGERCKLAAQGPQGVCWNHDPKNAEQRRKQASKAATAKADKEVREVKGEIRELIRRVRDEGFDATQANAINRLYNTLLAYILAERGIYREEDLAVRIRELGEGK
jgi:L-lactate utilization protein LutB